MYRYRNASKFDNPPHAFAMANHAYHAMIHEKKNQRFEKIEMHFFVLYFNLGLSSGSS